MILFIPSPTRFTSKPVKFFVNQEKGILLVFGYFLIGRSMATGRVQLDEKIWVSGWEIKRKKKGWKSRNLHLKIYDAEERGWWGSKMGKF